MHAGRQLVTDVGRGDSQNLQIAFSPLPHCSEYNIVYYVPPYPLVPYYNKEPSIVSPSSSVRLFVYGFHQALTSGTLPKTTIQGLLRRLIGSAFTTGRRY